VRFGIVTPVLTLLPRAHAKWEADGELEDVVAIARAADRLGYAHLTCSEHVVVPEEIAAVRGGRYWDPLATFGYLSACTERIKFATHVLVLGYHHPLEIAKRYGTLDRVCGGRLVLGVGVGSLREEFELLGVPFEGRGDIADDALRALRASLSQREPVYRGSHFAYEGMIVDPCAMQARVPLWIGGRTARSLRRAVELADGWAPFGLGTEDLARVITRAKGTPAWQERAEPIDLVLQCERALDPGGDPAAATAAVTALAEAGATAVNFRFVHHSLEHYLEQLEAMAAIAPQFAAA
jgi:probable F420-dependent oxidoreductase